MIMHLPLLDRPVSIDTNSYCVDCTFLAFIHTGKAQILLSTVTTIVFTPADHIATLYNIVFYLLLQKLLLSMYGAMHRLRYTHEQVCGAM